MTDETEDLKSFITNRINDIIKLVLKYTNKKDDVLFDKELRNRYTNKYIIEKRYRAIPDDKVPYSPPMLIRTFRRTISTDDQVDVIEARNNITTEFYRKLDPLVTLSKEQVEYIVNNMTSFLVFNMKKIPSIKNIPDEWVQLYVKIDNTIYDLLYNGSFYLGIPFCEKKILLNQNAIENPKIIPWVYLDVLKASLCG